MRRYKLSGRFHFAPNSLLLQRGFAETFRHLQEQIEFLQGRTAKSDKSSSSMSRMSRMSRRNGSWSSNSSSRKSSQGRKKLESMLLQADLRDFGRAVASVLTFSEEGHEENHEERAKRLYIVRNLYAKNRHENARESKSVGPPGHKECLPHPACLG